MIHKDYIPGATEKSHTTIPHGFDYWNPAWKIENGKVVKPSISKEETVEVKQEKSAYFKCNKCEFETKNERGMKIHVKVKHKAEQ